MHKNRPVIIPVVLILALSAAAIWFLWQEKTTAENGALQASGSIEAREVSVAPEISGKVSQVLVEKGQAVEAGQTLFRIEDELLQAQRNRLQAAINSALAAQETAQKGLPIAQAGVDLAQAQLQTARTGLELAKLQDQRAFNLAHLADQPARMNTWKQNLPGEFEQPAWYFEKSEEISAAEAELKAAEQVLEAETTALAKVLQNAGGDALVQAENRLAKAQAGFLVAQGVIDQARTASNGADLESYAQQLFDSADQELKSAQEDYQKLLSDAQNTEILEARARVAVAQEWVDAAQDRLSRMQTGPFSLEVQIAQVAIRQAAANLGQADASVAQAQARQSQAEASLSQARAAVAQAQAELKLLDLQLERLEVKAPAAGVVLQRNIEPGELAQAGATLIVLGELQPLTITVYLPEDRYGEVNLAERAEVRVDSFPGKVFEGVVQKIADQAEFTPRNVQTIEGRKTTVFAIELSIDNQDGKLKPGMPADITFVR